MALTRVTRRNLLEKDQVKRGRRKKVGHRVHPLLVKDEPELLTVPCGGPEGGGIWSKGWDELHRGKGAGSRERFSSVLTSASMEAWPPTVQKNSEYNSSDPAETLPTVSRRSLSEEEGTIRRPQQASSMSIGIILSHSKDSNFLCHQPCQRNDGE